jgi:hypothetical protein
MANRTCSQLTSALDRTAEVQGYFTPVPIPLPNPEATTPLPQTLPQSVLSFSRSLKSITFPYPVHLPGVIDPPNPTLG